MRITRQSQRVRWARWLTATCGLLVLTWLITSPGRADKPAPAAGPAGDFASDVRPLVAKYCLKCHSAKEKKGDLDLERFSSLEALRQDTAVWQGVLEQLEAGEMPPKKSPQPTAEERQRLIAWVRGFLDAEARARAGDPGRVVIRRLSNVEYNHTIRDLTRVDLQPARDFPSDGAAGEGFTNAGDGLVLSPTLLNKYLAAAKDISAHMVLLPDGFRFSPAKTRRDWTDEAIAKINAFYLPFGADGKLPLTPYLAATLRHRDDLATGKVTTEAIATREKLNAKYLQILWTALTDKEPSFPLDGIRARWREAGPKDAESLAAEVRGWQTILWKFNKIGSYMSPTWQEGSNVNFVASHPMKLRPTLAKGQNEVVFYLVARELSRGKEPTQVVWHRPRFEGAGQVPFLLRDVAEFPGPFEVDYRAAFGDSARCLAAVADATKDKNLTLDVLAKKYNVEPAAVKRWLEFLAAEPPPGEAPVAPALTLLPRKLPDNAEKPAIKGWGDATNDTLPVVVSNASDKEEKIPGTAAPHKVVVHPSPSQLAVLAWNCPIDGSIRVEARVAHAHHPGGNGVAWWLEQRRGDTLIPIENGVIDSGKKAEAKPVEVKAKKGDLVVLAIGARDGNHICDLTAIDLTLTEVEGDKRKWDLGNDVADTILEANPHADKFGNKAVWQFAKAPDPTATGKASPRIPRGSILAQWREAVADPNKADQLGKVAELVQSLLIGNRPDLERTADRQLYDTLVSADGPLLRGTDLTRWVKARPGNEKKDDRFGLPAERFGKHPSGGASDDGSLVVAASSITEVRVPAAVFANREFVVEGTVDAASAGSVVQFEVLTAAPRPGVASAAPCVALPGSTDVKALTTGFDSFRRCFPVYLHYPRVVPDDEIICLRLYFREDEQLQRLFLTPEQTKQIDALWGELRYISQYPLTESRNFPTFMGFVSQEGPEFYKKMDAALREPVRERAETFEKDLVAAQPKHLEALSKFAAQAYRRPLADKEKAILSELYQALRQKDLSHEEAFRTLLARVLISPSFLYRLEQPAEGKLPEPVTNWELATRLSYFLWATTPDEELQQLAAAGKLGDPQVLSAQVTRMLKDPKARGLATEFASQWLHVRDIRENREKNEKLFPTFDDNLRSALFEETTLFFQDLYQNDRSVLDVLDADATFLNEALAKHYGIPEVKGPEWRRVSGMKKYGRGGVLGMGSVLTKQSGASRTSPVLRGNWVVEVLLGEKTPRPPANVPRLPEEETGGEDLTVRQLVEKHVSDPSCAVCHQRIDPFGFSLEKYDPIGRLREKDLAGRAIDTKATLRDGTNFEGIDGLRGYLLTQRKEDFLRQFCKKLLGYSLGRSVTLSDHVLIEEMMSELKKNDYRFSAAVQTIARSKQFRYHRGRETAKED